MDFYFNIESDTHRQTCYKALADLKKSPGWKMLMVHYKGARQRIEEQVFDVDGDYEPKYNATDLLKLQRNQIKEFSSIIDSFMEFCSPDTTGDLTSTLDPYDRSLLNRSSSKNPSPDAIDGVAL